MPITGGNVSLYNETDGQAIYPTPVIGVVGLVDHADNVLSRRFFEPGDAIVLLGEGHGELGGSAYLETVHDMVRGRVPALDLALELRLQQLLVALAASRLIRSAHDCSDGGFAVALSECCFDTDGLGADVLIKYSEVCGHEAVNDAATVFGESASRVIASSSQESVAGVLQQAAAARVPALVIGQTGGNRVRVRTTARTLVDISVSDAERVWASALERQVAKRVA